MPDDDIIFTELNEYGSPINDIRLARADIRACPHLILMPEHYRDNGKCRCNDPTHKEMAEWEYTWDEKKGLWV